MWIILGNKVQTQRVPGGRKVERQCSTCGEIAMFYEREVSKSFRLYFVNLFNYETQRVMACGACGEHYATDELGRPLESDTPAEERQKGTVVGAVKDVLRRAGNAIQDATGVKADPDVAEPEEPAATAKKTIMPEAKRLAASSDTPSDDDFVDPLSEDDDDLNARFAALEKKMAKNRSAQKPIK
jgi:hypothetical protein